MKKKSKFELEIVDNVKRKRKELNKTQSYLGMLLNVTDGYIGQIESANSPSMYSYDQLNKIALDFGCSPKDFMPMNGLMDN